MLLRRAVLVLAAALASCKTPQPCPEPLVECEGQCIDIQSNRTHCGACGIACPTGRICSAATCIQGVREACPIRTGGAFVTFGQCGQAVKLWVEQPSFISDAASYVGSTTPAGTAVLEVLAGADCDVQWSWHVNVTTPVFQATAPGSCAVCPSAVQANVAAHGTFCPALVLAVDPIP